MEIRGSEQRMKSSNVMLRVLSGAVLVSALVLTGCAVGPRYQRPSATVPKSWTLDQGAGTNPSEPSVQWWKFFKDDEFSRLIERAVRANLDLKLAAARIAEARAQAGIAESGLLPSVTASASASRNRQRVIAVSPASPASAHIVPIEFNNFQDGFDASWELDVFGSVRRGLQAASADTRAAAEARPDVLVTLLGEVGRSYIELRRLSFQVLR